MSLPGYTCSTGASAPVRHAILPSCIQRYLMPVVAPRTSESMQFSLIWVGSYIWFDLLSGYMSSLQICLDRYLEYCEKDGSTTNDYLNLPRAKLAAVMKPNWPPDKQRTSRARHNTYHASHVPLSAGKKWRLSPMTRSAMNICTPACKTDRFLYRLSKIYVIVAFLTSFLPK